MRIGVFVFIGSEKTFRGQTIIYPERVKIHAEVELTKRSGQDPMNTVVATAMGGSMAWLEMVMNFQREMQQASFQSLLSYGPSRDTRITGEMPRQADGVQIIPVGEERLNVATTTVQGETTRIRRRVVSQPVEQQIILRDEKVVVERRPSTGGDSKPDVLTETVVEMSDSRQVPKVWKSLHVAEEVVLRMQVTERTEKVRETVRRDVVDVEHARAAVSGPERESNVALLPPRQEPAGERQEPSKAQGAEDKPQPSNGKRQLDEQYKVAAASSPAGAAPQPGARKS